MYGEVIAATWEPKTPLVCPTVDSEEFGLRWQPSVALEVVTVIHSATSLIAYSEVVGETGAAFILVGLLNINVLMRNCIGQNYCVLLDPRRATCDLHTAAY